MSRKQNSLMRFSRTERLAQLSEQEIVIERKKREIQAKIEAKKKEETEEALRKIEASKETKNNKPGFSKNISWKRDEYQRGKSNAKSIEEEKKESLKNAFSNDGSFLDQFKKLSQTGLASNNVSVRTLGMVTKGEGLDRRQREENDFFAGVKNFNQNDYRKGRDIRPENMKNDIFELNDADTAGKTFDANVQLQIPPPNVFQSIPRHHVPMMNVSVQNAVPMVPPPSVQIPMLQPILNSVPKFTTNEIQLKAISSPSYTETPSNRVSAAENLNPQGNLGAMERNSYHFMLHHPPLTTQPPSIEPSLPFAMQSMPSPSSVLKNTHIHSSKLTDSISKHHTETISMTFKNNAVKKLELTSNPFKDDDDDGGGGGYDDENEIHYNSSDKESRFYKKEKASSLEKSRLNIPPLVQTSQDSRESSRISPAFYNEEDNEEKIDGENLDRNMCFSETLKQRGGNFEDLLRKRQEADSSLEQKMKEHDEHVKKQQWKFLHNSLDQYEEDSNDSPSSRRQSAAKMRKEDSSDSEGYAPTPYPLKNKREPIEEDSDAEENSSYYKMPQGNSRGSFSLSSRKEIPESRKSEEVTAVKSSEEGGGNQGKSEERRKRKRKSRWGEAISSSGTLQPPTLVTNLNLQPPGKLLPPKTNLLSQLTRSDPGLIQYARQTFGSTNLSEEDWKKAEDHYKINLLYQDLVKKRAEIEKLERAGKFKYEYDSDEDVEGGTWEHKLRQQEMMATQLWAEELTRQAAGKHHIGDFLPPEELERFMEKYNAVKEGREPDLSDYKEFKLKEDNVGYKLLQKMGWNEGQGLGQDGSGITHPVNKATTRHENQGLGIERPDGLEPGDDEYDAYRKRMMLAYRFRPNPLNNPRRPYY